MSVAHLLNETLTQKRVTARESDGQGGFSKLEDVVDAAFRGRISSGSAQERQRGGRSEASYIHTLFAAGGADVRRDDIFERADGTRLVVVAVRQLSLRRHVEAILEEQRAGA